MSYVHNRYKAILDNRSAKKTGRGAKTWAFFDRMHHICGDRASSVSLHDAAMKQTAGHKRHQPALSSACLQSSASTSVPADTLSATSVESSLLCSDCDDDEENSVSECKSLKQMCNKGIVKRKKRVEKAPQWYVEAENRMRKSQEEWRNELCKRMDKQEQQQAERIALLKQANTLLRDLINTVRSEQ